MTDRQDRERRFDRSRCAQRVPHHRLRRTHSDRTPKQLGDGRALRRVERKIGSDVRRDVVNFAQTNARAAGVGNLIRFETRDLLQLRPPVGPPGVLLCNPPYGERLGEENELKGLYRALGEVLGRHFGGWTAFVFTGNPRLADQVGLTPAQQIPLFNGKIPCRLLRYELGAGRV